MQIHIDVMEDRAGRSYFVVSCEEKGGKVYTRHLTYDQMLEVLSRSGASEKSYYPMGRLPEGYVDAVMDSEGGGKVKIYVPPKERVFFLRVQEEKMPMSFRIPMPAMLFEVSFGGKRLSGACCVVDGTYEEVLNDYYEGRLAVYRYPFGNVSEYGSVCMGNISYEVKNAFEANAYVDAFFDGVTNADYFQEGNRLRSKMGQMEFLGKLEKMKSFPMLELYELKDSLLGIPYQRQIK